MIKMLDFEDVPNLDQVEFFVKEYDRSLLRLCHSKVKTNISSENICYFIAATWMCNREQVLYQDFLKEIILTHRKMEPNKVLPAHQLCTEFSSQVIMNIQLRYFSKTPEGRAVYAAEKKSGVPLCDDYDYMDKIHYLFQGYRSTVDQEVYDAVYIRERMKDMGEELKESDPAYVILKRNNLLEEGGRMKESLNKQDRKY